MRITKYPDLEYSYRPESYFGPLDNPLSELLRNVKGTFRRKQIRELWKNDWVDEIQEFMISEGLSDQVRDRVGAIHPSFMSGEYLPDLKLFEEEIARIHLESTLGDVISIRARPVGRRIQYRIIDEYEADFDLPFKTSTQPLTMERLIKMINNANTFEAGYLPWCYTTMNMGSSTNMRGFTTVSSEFYPELYEHYSHEEDDLFREYEEE